VLMLRLELRTY